jgi:hypothetical protein
MGIWSISGGDTYEGEYMNDKKCGEGIYTWKNGCKYKGQFENDLRHGYGEMIFLDGRVEKGSWVDGIQRGRKCFEVRTAPPPNNHRTTVKQSSNPFKQTKEIFRINRTVYKKTRISRAMQVKLESIANERLQETDTELKKTIEIKREFVEDSY